MIAAGAALVVGAIRQDCYCVIVVGVSLIRENVIFITVGNAGD
jgi:hypothetical protein